MKRLNIIIIALLAALIGSLGLCYGAETVSISTPQELAAMDPHGSYKLECDLDMAGTDWMPKEFAGCLDGQGHTIYNLTVNKVGTETRTVYDGNYKEYDTHFAGMFSVLAEGAKIENLNLAGACIEVTDYPDPVFAGILAGCMDGGEVQYCSIEGYVDLRTSGKCFGTGGAAGYGKGSIRDCTIQSVQVCIDRDKENRDEQFMGGAYAAGFIDLANNNVSIEGYDSDHGYVHDGGLVGMYILFPRGTSYRGYITNNHIGGAIHFFEDNTDRRAYCAPYIGEVMQWTYEWGGCTENFKRDETRDYSRDLLPCMDGGSFEAKTIDPTYESMGYTDYTCPSCGYSFRKDYTLPIPKVINLVDTTGLPEIQEEAPALMPKIALAVCGAVVLIAAFCLYALLTGKRGKH
ncbi:MAG: hypothetical protein MJ186_06770 [Clostridia bacterium]|nr:hypothetical protein [Clostridia bacterium]